jgi:hypothetical protein
MHQRVSVLGMSTAGGGEADRREDVAGLAAREVSFGLQYFAAPDAGRSSRWSPNRSRKRSGRRRRRADASRRRSSSTTSSEIESWDWSYWLALNTLRDPPDPYHEHRHLQIKGRMLRPTGLKTDRVEVSLFPTINLEEERRKELKPLALGALESYPNRIDAILGIPSDALAPMLQMLTADRLKFAVQRGTKQRPPAQLAALGEDDLSPPD